MNRFRAALVAIALALLISTCQTPRYEGHRYKVTLDSSPTGATLYLVPRSDWLELGRPRASQDLQRWIVKQNGGIAPVVDYWVVDHKHTLVGRLGATSGELEFRPTEHGLEYVVTLRQP